MWCPTLTNGSNVNKSVSEYACHQLCFELRQEFGKDACNSIMLFEEFPVGQRDPEVFLLQYPVTLTAQSITSARASNIFPEGYSVATFQQLQGAWSSGMQTCVEGWFLRAPQNALQARLIQQLGCPGNESIQNSLSIFSPTINSNHVFVFGDKQGLRDLSVTTFSILPFFTATSAPSLWDPKYTFSNQFFQSEQSCAFFLDRTDILVAECTSLSAHPGVSSSNLLDIPYSFAQSCSVTDWETVHDCSQNCELIFAETRTVVNARTSQGGLPCSRVPTYYSTVCTNFNCQQTFGDVCILSPLPTSITYQNSCTDPSFASDVFLEHFSQSYIYDWAFLVSSTLQTTTPISGQDTALSQFFSSTIRKNAFGGHLRPELIDAVNAQCGQALCLSLSIGYYSLSAVTAPLGWIELEGQTCTTVSAVQACLDTRLALLNAPGYVPGKFVWDSALSQWKCPNTCRPGGLSFSCAMGQPPLTPCVCTPPYLSIPPLQTETLLYQQYINSNGTILYQCNIKPPQNFIFGCSTSSVCPDLPCPIGNDGSPCNTFSGQGVCDLAFGTCTCASPTYSKLTCNNTCSRGSNGLPCSGEGTCEYGDVEFTCSCNPGRSGDACQLAGTGLVGLLETLFYTSTSLISNIATNNFFSFTYQNLEPRCEENQQYCAGSQLFVPDISNIFHPFYPPPGNTQIPFPMDYANICVNSLDASFNSQWIGANYLSVPLISLTNAGTPQQASLGINCESYIDTSLLPNRPAYAFKARFTSHSSIPPQLQNKLFYTRCPNSNVIAVGSDNFKYYSSIQYDSNGNALFDLVDEQTTLEQLCLRFNPA
jgi:hypothetical protein